jgi:cell division transport system permease protein
MKLLELHFRSFLNAIVRILKHPLEHLFNILVISAITAILGAVLVITNTSNIWQKHNVIFPQIMVYLNDNAKDSDVSFLEKTINKYNPQIIKNYQFISKTKALQELQQDPQLKQITSNLITDGANPLPDVLILNPITTNQKQLQQLVSKITKVPMVSEVQLDVEYANKISDLINFVREIALDVQILFSLVLILVIYNMIRLQMLLRQDEIIVSRLIGASNSFIMRPLTYYAVLQVIIGTLIASLLLNWFIKLINNLFLNFNNLFGEQFLLSYITPIQLLIATLILIIFSVFAVFLAVQWVFQNSFSQ